jgi:hypothetical protein
MPSWRGRQQILIFGCYNLKLHKNEVTARNINIDINDVYM